ncbi:nickel pincer cofactor biosynthesis protein LarC [Candidatus Sumerlaeota bacterium]|nr:nickel pincer cofactor biosynthesis protein LarC [Candidatus Sumerlaeota bacterium]
MKIAYFDCSYGIAGDMVLGALVDAGGPFDLLKRELEKGLGVHGIRLIRRKIVRGGVTATRIEVRTDPTHDHHRHLGDIERILTGTRFPDGVKKRAIEAYRRLARAEAKIHNTTIEKIHFHEVGCLDAIADVAGAMLLLDAMEIERVEASPVVVGSGTARCAHGILPVPAPATAEILRGVPTLSGPHAMEMTTPTGATILTTVASAFGPQPEMAVDAIGYGAGKREIEGHANLLRVIVGQTGQPEASDRPYHVGHLCLLITEIDDMNPEILGDTLTRLFAAGCLDAHFTSVQMKKNRPGTQLQVLCRFEDREPIVEFLLRETSTFGVKALEVDRFCLLRRSETVSTPLGSVAVKVGLWAGETLKVTPEFESCRDLAEKRGRPLGEVYRLADAAIQSQFFSEGKKTTRARSVRRSKAAS